MGSRLAKPTLKKKKKKIGRLRLFHFKIYYKTTVIKTV